MEIPRGVEDNNTLRLQRNNQTIYVTISVEDDSRFERKGADLHSTHKISFAQAALGAEISVETIDGRAKLEIPAGTQSHTLFRLKGKGMPSLHGEQGDHFVRIIIETPKHLNKEDREFYEKQLGKQSKKEKKGFLKKMFG